jgi:flagellar M-ring protein FliF
MSGIFETIPGLKQVLLLVGVSAAIAAAIWLVLWSQGQSYAVLYNQLSERESGQVMDALAAVGIEFKLNPAGAIMVPESKVQDARIRLASQGLPQSDAMGIEMIQKESALGTSSLMENARYQSALETELGRTIAKVMGVQAARVHLALPKASVFVQSSRRATASVMLQLYAGRRLEPGQVAAIVHLVASSVPDLEASQVTVVDQAGSLLNSPDETEEMSASARQFDYTRKLEHSYQDRIVEMLEPMLGVGRVRATVTAAVDFTVSEQSQENYDPQKTAVRSEQLSKDEHGAGDSAQGVPGALSNQPPGTTGAPPAVAPAAAAAVTATNGNAPLSSSSRSTRNFEVDRTLSYTKHSVGELKKLSIGVVLDDWQKISADGKATNSPLNDTDIKRFTELVKQAVGFDAARGDQINVINQSFKSEAALPPPEATPIWQQNWVKDIGKQLFGAVLVLIVAFLVLRPLMKSLTRPQAPSGGMLSNLTPDQMNISRGGAGAAQMAPSFEQQVAAARNLVGQDPKRAAQVVKEWVAND